MHARNRTWPLGSDPAERCRQRTLPVEGGDGSTLSLDFTTGVLDPRLTFTRLGNATFINSSGLVEWAAANMLVRSNELSNTGSWVRTGVVAPTSSSSAPTGDAAWRLEESAGVAGTHSLSQSPLASQGLPYTFSILVKKDQRNWIVIQIATATFVYFDANAGVFGTTSGTLIGYDKIDAGDGWWRIYVSANATAASLSCVVYLASANGTVSYTGVSGNGLFISSPQIEPGVVMRSYNQTGSAAYHAPRFDYDPTSIGTPRGLLIEGAATNICTYSGDMTQSGAGHWTQRVNLDTSAWTGFTAPDGTATAVKLIPNTTNGLHNIQNVSGSLTLVAYTASAFVKADGRTVVGLAIGGSQAWQNFVLTGNGSLGSASTSPAPTSTITPVGSTGWYRVTMTWTSTLSAVGVQLYVTLPQTSSTSPFSAYAGDGTQNGVQAWGYQLETGSGASSYIPTGASTGSRAADFCYQDGISSWFTSQSSLTMLVDATPRVQTSFPVLWLLTDAGGGNSYQLYYNSVGTTNSYTTKVVVGSVNAGEFTLASSVQQDTRQVIGYAIASGVGVRSRNGVSGTAAVPTSLPTTALTKFAVGSSSSGFPANAHIRRIKYWPYALTQDQLNGATTT